MSPAGFEPEPLQTRRANCCAYLKKESNFYREKHITHSPFLHNLAQSQCATPRQYLITVILKLFTPNAIFSCLMLFRCDMCLVRYTLLGQWTLSFDRCCKTTTYFNQSVYHHCVKPHADAKIKTHIFIYRIHMGEWGEQRHTLIWYIAGIMIVMVKYFICCMDVWIYVVCLYETNASICASFRVLICVDDAVAAAFALVYIMCVLCWCCCLCGRSCCSENMRFIYTFRACSAQTLFDLRGLRLRWLFCYMVAVWLCVLEEWSWFKWLLLGIFSASVWLYFGSLLPCVLR